MSKVKLASPVGPIRATDGLQDSKQADNYEAEASYDEELGSRIAHLLNSALLELPDRISKRLEIARQKAVSASMETLHQGMRQNSLAEKFKY